MLIIKKLFKKINNNDKTKNTYLEKIIEKLKQFNGVVKYEVEDNTIYIVGLENDKLVKITYEENHYVFNRIRDNFKYMSLFDVIESYIFCYYEVMSPIEINDTKYCYHEHGDLEAFTTNTKGELVCKICKNVIPRRGRYINAD